MVTETTSTYRDPDLTNEQAWAAMQTACRNVVRAVLAERKTLLDSGFGDGHELCQQIDDVARAFALNEQVVLREWLHATCPPGHEVRSTQFGYVIAQIAEPPP